MNQNFTIEESLVTLKDYFGYDKFRPLQQEIIQTILSGENCLVLMPTGGGKSICFQIPAIMFPGVTIVVSPLIALMKDQVESLRANGVQAAFLNSSIDSGTQNEIWHQAHSGILKLLYLSPEKLFQPGIMDEMKRLHISLVAIDESHCISSWGHDFRPEYRHLSIFKSQIPDVPFVALTATADRVTRKDILFQLGMPNAKTFISSFDRPNLSLQVSAGLDRKKQILQFLKSQSKNSGIIYCLSRKGTEDLAMSLNAAGYKADFYHAGCEPLKRAKTQEAFIKDEVQIMCATIAFGMGIDKSNIRWVMHYNLPNNVESYYQEIGRAGRDGLPSKTILFYSYGDLITRLDMIEKSEADEEQKELRRAKLDRMKQFAEAQICRRRILLSYFNEETIEDCGNCDVCKNPRASFDGTILAQKALSAIARTQEKVSMTALVDLLRGQRTAVTVKYGYTELKTFGAGKELKTEFWMDYLLQMLNSGIMDIAYDEGHVFKLNNLSWKVLKEEYKVLLAQARTFESRMAEKAENKPVKEQVKENANQELFEALRKLRKQIADEESVPAYVVFSDATLNDMVLIKPINVGQMKTVQGVGQVKLEKYGAIFLKEIQNYLRNFKVPGTRLANGVTYLETLELYNKGLDIEEIAIARNLAPSTMVQHLIKLKSEGESIDLEKFISKAARKTILEIISELNLKLVENMKIQEILERVGEAIPSWQIRLILHVEFERKA